MVTLRSHDITIRLFPTKVYKQAAGNIAKWSFSNDDGDGDGDGNVKKAIGLLSKITSLHVHHIFLHFFAVNARLRHEKA